MTIEELQKSIDSWIRGVGGGYFSELTNMALLAEEVGEVARIISRVYGDQIAKRGDLSGELGDELADVIWVAVCLANQTGVNLDEALKRSLEKKSSRDAGRFAERRGKE